MNKNMLRFVNGILLLLTLSSYCIAENDFRKASWGMSKADVIKSEGAEPLKEGMSVLDTPYIGYQVRMRVGENNHELATAYYFVEDQLYFAKYVILTTHTNLNDYLIDFEDFKVTLTKKYGEPLKDDTVWKDELYKDDQSNWGTAISTGRMEKSAIWETETTRIVLQLKGDNYKISFEIRYETKDERLLALEEQLKAKKEQSAF